MPKGSSVEERLAEVARLGKDPDAPEAADRIAHLEDREFNADLIAAFHRFMINPEKTDKGCAAKTAVVKALLAADIDDDEVFRIGVRHVQLEPTWGGRSDTAAQLRALCGLGLVQVGSSEALIELAALLADKEP